MRAEEAAGVGRRALALALAVGRGAAGLTEIEEAAGDGVITAGRRAALEARVAARQAEAEAQARRAERVAATVSGDGKALDPKDPEHRQAVEEAFAAILSESADLEPEAFAAQAAQFAGATGIVPERLVTRVSAGLRSQDANTQANAARLLIGIVEPKPDSMPDPTEALIFVPKPDEGFVFPPEETVRAQSIVRYLDAGIAPAEAARLAAEDTARTMANGAATQDDSALNGGASSPLLRLVSHEPDGGADGAAEDDGTSGESSGALLDQAEDIDVVEAEDGDGVIFVDAETGEPLVNNDGKPARVSQDQLDRFDEAAEKVAEVYTEGEKVDGDLAEEIGLLVLDLAPGTGNVLSAVEAAEAFTAAYEAVENGDFEEALKEGGWGALATLGAVPGIGWLARFSRVGVKAVGLVGRLLIRPGARVLRKAEDVVNPNKIADGARVKRGNLAEISPPELQSTLKEVRALRRGKPPGKRGVTPGERTLQLEINKRNGNAWEVKALGEATATAHRAGHRIVRRPRVKTSHGSREFDWAVVNKQGKVVRYVEAKAGKGRRSKAQKLKDKEVEKEGTPVDVVRESDVKRGGGND